MFCTRASSRSNPEACGMRSSTMPANTSRRPVEFPIYCEQDRVPTFVTARLAVGASHALERDQPRAILAACRRGERSVRVRTVRRRQLRRPPTRGRRLRAWLYHQLRRRFSQQNRDRLKAELFRLRRALRGLYRFRYGTFSAVELRSELAARLPSDFEILMVHCSLNDLAPAYTGTALELLNELVALCGPERTLAMPAFVLNTEEAVKQYETNPRFDVRRQPSQMGLLSEMFRRRAGVRRSLHPTHSICALGPLAAELTNSHHLAATTFGEGTPFGIMARRKTVIAGIATHYFRVLTQVHAAEDLLGESF